MNEINLLEKLNEKGNQVLDYLKTIELESGSADNARLLPVKSYLSNYSIIDDSMQANLNYRVRVNEILEPKTKMNKLVVQTNIKTEGG